jgi:hypothetical protein
MGAVVDASRLKRNSPVAARAQVAHKGFETERVYYGRVAVAVSASHHGHHRGHLL